MPKAPTVAKSLVALSDIPSGLFKDQLMALSDSARQFALLRMATWDVHEHNYNSMRVDSDGMIFFVCSLAGHLPLETAAAVGGGQPIENDTSAQVSISAPPALHSRPGASKVIFLDFNGQTISGTAWNNEPSYGSVASWDCLPYSIDSNEDYFSATELNNITQIWARVAEDYSPFDVDVTTEQPSSWTRNVAHALITPGHDRNGVACPHNGFGGVAYIGVFGMFYNSYDYSKAYSPAWVMEMGVSSTAEAISHEVGHNMGLLHDGTVSAEYYVGHDNGSVTWGPIMGTSYYSDITQWSKGEYYQANNGQDDLMLLALKLSYRSDDHGNDQQTATALTDLGAGLMQGEGVIERTGEQDVFSFVLNTRGEVTISASPYRAPSGYWGGNLDIQLDLKNSVGTTLFSVNPELQADATLTEILDAGTYYVYVLPVGVGNSMANPPTGYTSYGSLGQYVVEALLPNDVDNDGIPDRWELSYFSDPAGANSSADSDGDGTDNLTEYIAGTDPLNSNSSFQVTSNNVPVTGVGMVLNWESVEGRIYSISWSGGLTNGFSVIKDNLNYPQNSYTDMVERASSGNYYRINVRLK